MSETQDKGYYEKLLKEYPECEKEIKDSYGYQIEMLGNSLRAIGKEIADNLGISEEALYKFIETINRLKREQSFKYRIKRFFKMIFNKIKGYLRKLNKKTKKD